MSMPERGTGHRKTVPVPIILTTYALTGTLRTQARFRA